PPPVAPELPVHNDDPEPAAIGEGAVPDEAAFRDAVVDALALAPLEEVAVVVDAAHHLLYSPTPSPPPSGFYPPPPAPPGSPPVCTPDCPASGH
ncbi:unnamed protein product, partial [Closterium sp. Naga37s-1]